MAKANHSPCDPQPHAIPDAIAPGLDLFAAAWLQQWVEAGGSVLLAADYTASLGFPDYYSSPAFVKASANLSAEQHVWRDAHYNGKMRGLLAAIQALPCGYQAIEAHMRSHGMSSYFDKIGAGRS
jgi:hypothetical protein